MRAQIEKYVRRNWLWLLVNLAVLFIVVRTGILVSDVSPGDAWSPSSPATSAARRVVRFSGMTALVLLVLSLSCTPLSTLFGFRRAIGVRKSLGLWAFAFALFHALFLVGSKPIFYDAEAWQIVWLTAKQALDPGVWVKIPYARVGVYTLLLLLPLVLTSNRTSMRLLGKNWKRLHRIVYVAALLAIWHYLWGTSNQRHWLASSAGAISWLQPGLFAVVVAVLLIVRIPAVRRQLVHLIRRMQTSTFTPFSRQSRQV